MVEEFDIEISDTDYADLNQRCPKRENSHDIGRRAVEIMKLYFRSLNRHVEFEVGENGIDLQIMRQGKMESIEVKGTLSSDISWSKLKVSSQSSYDRLCEGTKLCRVVGVNNRRPRLYVLRYGDDFEMVPEARWAVRRP